MTATSVLIFLAQFGIVAAQFNPDLCPDQQASTLSFKLWSAASSWSSGVSNFIFCNRLFDERIFQTLKTEYDTQKMRIISISTGVYFFFFFINIDQNENK
jgi:hypothetical protein